MGQKKERMKAIVENSGKCDGECPSCPLSKRVCYAGECPDDLKKTAAAYWLCNHKPKKEKGFRSYHYAGEDIKKGQIVHFLGGLAFVYYEQ